MADLNWVDYIILAIFFFSILAGFGRGFVREIIGLITLFASFIIAAIFSNQLAMRFTHSAGVQHAVNQASSTIGVDTSQPVSYMAIGISYTLLFAGTYIVGSLIGYFMNMAFQWGVLGLANRFFGAVFGAIRGFILNLVLIFLVQLTPVSTQAAWQHSQLVVAFQPAVLWLANIVSPSLANLKERMGNTLQNMDSSIKGMSDTYQGLSR